MDRLCKLLFAFVLLAVVSLPGALFAAVSGDDSVANVMISEKEIEWLPHVPHDQLVLTVSGPGDAYFSETFPAGSNPFFELFDNDGVPFPDGSYTYELRVIPDVAPDRIGSLSEGRGSTDGVVVSEESVKKSKQLQESLVQTGYFTIRKGYLVVGDGEEIEITEAAPLIPEDSTTRYRDIVHNDDVIIVGSLCVGFDCVNGESFGFDTIRLKENNLRIKFDDTSTAASYPRNDWQLTANDSANGGAEKFSIDDIGGGRTPFTIEHSAPSHSLYVDDGGRVGFGTSTPVVDNHIVSGNTPTLRLEQNGSSGFSPQTWDVAGNEAGFFIRDATGGSTLPFRIRPGAPSSAVDIEGSTGDVGIGTGSPTFPLEIKRTSTNPGILLNRADTSKFKVNMTANQGQFGTQTAHKLNLVTNNVSRMTIDASNTYVGIGVSSPTNPLDVVGGANCDGTTWNDVSTREAKENIRTLTAEQAMEAFSGLSAVRFNYRIHNDEERLGFIAEDVPELVAMNGRKNLNAMDIVAVLTKVVQEQQKVAQQQQKIIEDLQGKIAEFEKK